jgi:protein-disulfide isomerase
MPLRDRIIQLNNLQKNPLKIRWYRKWWGKLIILALILLFGTIVAFAIYIYNTARTINEQKTAISQAEKIKATTGTIEGLHNYSLGAVNPQITLVEFSDFACPYCQADFLVVKKILAKYPNQVKLIYRDYLGHEDSLRLALLARCAGDQNDFWLMHDELFTDQGKVGDIAFLAQKLGLNEKQLTTCVNDQKYLSDIKKDMADAETLGISVTPTWAINGYLVKGALSEETFLELIDKTLNP